MVVEAGEPVGVRLLDQPLAVLGVVDRERRQVGKPADQLELVIGEGDVVAQAVDVEGADGDVTDDQGHARQRLMLVLGSARHHGDSRIVVRLGQIHRLTALSHPAGDSLADGAWRLHDLVRPAIDSMHRRQQLRQLVHPVDGDRVERHQPLQLGGDPLEQLTQSG